MDRLRYSTYLSLLIICIFPLYLYAQMEGLHGSDDNTAVGMHDGNLFRSTFYNDGTFGTHEVSIAMGGEWPINSAHIYLMDGNVFIGSEVIDTTGALKHVVSEVMGYGSSYSQGDFCDGKWCTFLPLPGFHNPDSGKIAMDKWKWSWPPYWPDIGDPDNPRYSPDGWAGSWNGYFGRDVFNADQESYFVVDDYENTEFAFFPDSTDSFRGGLGLRMYVRGFQWSNALVEDAIFALFDIENIGTHEHDKMVFGYKFGNNLGDTRTNSDVGDDCGAFSKEEDVAYLYDYDLVGASDWGTDPVGYFGGVFLESPGNHYDGIDNDNDGKDGSGPTISEAMFDTMTLNLTDEIIVIDYSTFGRNVVIFGDTLDSIGKDTLTIQYKGDVLKFWPGKEVFEIANDLVDNNLNGIIDENNGATFGEPPVTTYLYFGSDGTGYKYIDYSTGEGMDNLLIEEQRDDEIDNDGDWNALSDDLGGDGVAETGDKGEGDGLPTPGEPHFDQTDIDETDMLGLTSFTLYKWEDIPHSDDEKVWNNIIPGFFDNLMQNENIELLYGSGYFPMKPGQIERFSMGILCGINEDDFLDNTKWVTQAYNANYNFAKAPLIPIVKAVAGDERVTLYWDDKAERYPDPILGYDFEGYRIYRSTNPDWSDMEPITDYNGAVVYRKPIAQFDLDNDFVGTEGVFGIRGVQFYLGDNTGIVNSYVDSTVKNGFKYYYAVTSYDRGESGKIPPTECAKYLAVTETGEIEDKGTNVVVVRPEAPSAGYVPADPDSVILLAGGTTSGSISYEIIDPDAVNVGHIYHITFEDTLVGSRYETRRATKNFSLVDTNTGDILFSKCTSIKTVDDLSVKNGLKLSFTNPETLDVDTDLSRWSRKGIRGFSPSIFYKKDWELFLESADYQIIFGNVGIGKSTAWYRSATALLDSIDVNFKIINTSLNKEMKFAFRERHGEGGEFSCKPNGTTSDEIIFLNDSLIAGWKLSFDSSSEDTLLPEAGDTLILKLKKPFLSHDIFEFTVYAEKEDKELAKNQMDRIKVVPNPYIVTNSWEPKNPYRSGRGSRVLHFTHLPAKCTIKIFNIRGQLVDTIKHDTLNLSDGTEIWDMLSKDELDIAYGIYIYHIDAGDIGQKIGKFAVIK